MDTFTELRQLADDLRIADKLSITGVRRPAMELQQLADDLTELDDNATAALVR